MSDLIPGVVDLEQIGQGGQSTVFRGQQPEFGRPVAVKVFHATVDDERTRSRFQRECQAMGRFSEHPHVVTLYDSGVTQNSRPFLIMAYLPFGSLADRLATEGPLPWPEAVTIGQKMASALHEAHRAGILHRDMKPANVLLSSFGEPQLTDFGIVRIDGSETAGSSEIAGTPGYLAPELFDGVAPSVASDVYGLAATIHAMIAGRGPFASQSGEALLTAIERVRKEPAPSLRIHAVPPQVADVIERSLAKAPAERPRSAAALATALAGVAADAEMPAPDSSDRLPYRMADLGASPPTIIRPSPPIPPTEPTENSHRKLGIAALILLPVAVIAVGAALWIRAGQNDGRDSDARTGPNTSTVPSPATTAIDQETGTPDTLPDVTVASTVSNRPDVVTLNLETPPGELDAGSFISFAISGNGAEGISTVQLEVDGTRTGDIAFALPAQLRWRAPSTAGTHLVQAVVDLDDGAQLESPTVGVAIGSSPDTQPPTTPRIDPLIGRWITVFASVPEDDTPLAQERLAEARLFDARATTLRSDDYGSLTNNYLVVHLGPFGSAQEALNQCFEAGRTSRNTCYAALVSQDGSDSSERKYPD